MKKDELCKLTGYSEQAIALFVNNGMPCKRQRGRGGNDYDLASCYGWAVANRKEKLAKGLRAALFARGQSVPCRNIIEERDESMKSCPMLDLERLFEKFMRDGREILKRAGVEGF